MIRTRALEASHASPAAPDPEAAAKAKDALTKLAFGTGPMIGENLLQRYLDAAPDRESARVFLRQLFPVMYRLKPEARRLLSRTMLSLG